MTITRNYLYLKHFYSKFCFEIYTKHFQIAYLVFVLQVIVFLSVQLSSDLHSYLLYHPPCVAAERWVVDRKPSFVLLWPWSVCCKCFVREHLPRLASARPIPCLLSDKTLCSSLCDELGVANPPHTYLDHIHSWVMQLSVLFGWRHCRLKLRVTLGWFRPLYGLIILHVCVVILFF